MNKPDTEIKRWNIVVIQILNPNDYKTGEILYHDVLQYKEYHRGESFTLFYDVNSSDEFRLAVQTIEDLLSEGDILTLQIETHGCNNGIWLNNGDILKWKEFYDIIRPLNIKTEHLLFVDDGNVQEYCYDFSPYFQNGRQIFTFTTPKPFDW